LAKDLKNMEKT